MNEKQVLSNIVILEGAPALSEHWTLFDTNDAVFNAARTRPGRNRHYFR